MSKKEKKEKKAEATTSAGEGDKVDGVSGAAGDPSDAKSAQTGDKPSSSAGESAPAEAAADKSKDDQAPAEPDWKNLYAVTLADFDNYKKRAARDREEVYRYAESDIMKDILPVVDNLALALEHAKDKEDDFVKGVRLVHDGLLKALAGHGVKPMEDLVGKDLDPNFHEAIATLPNDEIEEGRISNIVKTGWTLNGKLLRAAQVVVSAGKKV